MISTIVLPFFLFTKDYSLFHERRSDIFFNQLARILNANPPQNPFYHTLNINHLLNDIPVLMKVYWHDVVLPAPTVTFRKRNGHIPANLLCVKYLSSCHVSFKTISVKPGASTGDP